MRRLHRAGEHARRLQKVSPFPLSSVSRVDRRCHIGTAGQRHPHLFFLHCSVKPAGCGPSFLPSVSPHSFARRYSALRASPARHRCHTCTICPAESRRGRPPPFDRRTHLGKRAHRTSPSEVRAQQHTLGPRHRSGSSWSRCGKRRAPGSDAARTIHARRPLVAQRREPSRVARNRSCWSVIRLISRSLPEGICRAKQAQVLTASLISSELWSWRKRRPRALALSWCSLSDPERVVREAEEAGYNLNSLFIVLIADGEYSGSVAGYLRTLDHAFLNDSPGSARCGGAGWIRELRVPADGG